MKITLNPNYIMKPSLPMKERLLFASRSSENDEFVARYGSYTDSKALMSIRERLASDETNKQVNGAKRIINLKSDDMRRDVIIEFLDVIAAKRPLSLKHVKNEENILAVFEAGLAKGNLRTHRVLADYVRLINNEALRARYIVAFMEHSDSFVQLEAAKKINSIMDESLKTELIKKCIEHSNQAITNIGFSLIKEIENQTNISTIIQTGLASSDPYTQSLLSKEIDRLTDEDLIKQFINQVFQLNNNAALKSALPAMVGLKSEPFKESIIDQLLSSDSPKRHQIAVNVINSLVSTEALSTYITRALSVCNDDILPLISLAVSKVEDDQVKQDFVAQMISKDLGRKIFELVPVFIKIKDPAFDPLKELCVQKGLGIKGSYLESVIKSIQDETLKSRWIHLGLQHEDSTIRLKAKRVIDDIRNPELKSQWLKTYRVIYSPNSKPLEPSDYTGILGQ